MHLVVKAWYDPATGGFYLSTVGVNPVIVARLIELYMDKDKLK